MSASVSAEGLSPRVSGAVRTGAVSGARAGPSLGAHTAPGPQQPPGVGRAKQAGVIAPPIISMCHPGQLDTRGCAGWASLALTLHPEPELAPQADSVISSLCVCLP